MRIRSEDDDESGVLDITFRINNSAQELTKVTKLGTEPAVHQNVASLQIAMEDWRPGGMKVAQTFGHISDDLHDDLTTQIHCLIPQHVM